VNDVPAAAEQPNAEGFAAFAERAGEDGPVQMLNLLSFKPDGGRERYEEYAQAVAPILQGLGGRLLYAGVPDPAMLGDSQWDLVAIAEYPSRQAFLDMVASPEYQAIAHLRTEAVAASELHPMDPVEDLPL
jgi:uncharacterized protein (DUF1330 family)